MLFVAKETKTKTEVEENKTERQQMLSTSVLNRIVMLCTIFVCFLWFNGTSTPHMLYRTDEAFGSVNYTANNGRIKRLLVGVIVAIESNPI